MVRPALQEMNVQQQQLVIQALHLQDSSNLSHQREYFCEGPGNCESSLALGKLFWAWCVYLSRCECPSPPIDIQTLYLHDSHVSHP